MDRRRFLASTLSAAVLPAGLASAAPERFPRLGWLTAQTGASLTPFLGAFAKGLAALGYSEGRNLHIEYRYGNDAVDRVPDLARELAKLPVDVLLVQGAAVQIVSKLELGLPIVFIFSSDPISAGLVESLARPRGNMTGMTHMSVEVHGKRLELLQAIVPGLRRVGVIANPQHSGEHLERAYVEETAARMGLAIEYQPTRTRDELAAALASIASNPPQALSVFADGFAIQNRKAIIDFATAHRIPLISGWAVFAESGALCTYGPRVEDSYRRLASYVDRILKGAKPADLPIERPTKFELVVNLKTAQALGITLPPSVMTLADEIIE